MKENNELFNDEFMNDMILNSDLYENANRDGRLNESQNFDEENDECDDDDEEDGDDDEDDLLMQEEEELRRQEAYEKQKDRDLSHIVFEQERLRKH